MYESLADFLRNFSAGYPLLWALLVMAAVAASGLTLHFLWQLLLRLLGRAFGGAASSGKSSAERH